MRLCLLNVPRLDVPGKVSHILERRDAALLAWFALEGPTQRKRIAQLIWPESRTARAADNNLRQRVYRLHKQVGQEVVVGDRALLLAEEVEHDLASVEQALLVDPDSCAGDVLGAFEYDDCEQLAVWVRAVRARWRAARARALEQIAQRLEAEGRIAQALRHAERLIADEPALETAHRQVMRLHAGRGDPGAAAAAYQRLCVSLLREVGATPDAQTQALLREIEAGGAIAEEPRRPRVAVLRPPRLVGRDVEWAAIAAAMNEPCDVVVHGEAGIGKTRLLSDFAAHHGQALFVAARAGDSADPYALIARLLRGVFARCGAGLAPWATAEVARLLPELGRPAAGRLDPLRLRLAIVHALATLYAAGVRLVALDDLHYGDAASLQLLPALMNADEPAIRWLIGTRSAAEFSEAVEWRGTDATRRLRRVELPRLDAAGVAELLRSLALPGIDPQALAPALVRHTGGNPLFILETLRALGPPDLEADAIGRGGLPFPANVGELIDERVRQLSPQGLALAQVAALATEDFGPELAAFVLGCHAVDLSEPWRELETADVIRASAFAHDLIFEAVLRSVPGTAVVHLRRAIAAYLEAHDGAPARVAQHWEAAQEWAKAAAAYHTAARSQRDASLQAKEAPLLENAIRCAEAAADRARAFDARGELVQAQLHLMNVSAARANAERLLRSACDERQRMDALNCLADVFNTAYESASAAAAAEEMLALARRLGDPREQFNAARKLAGAYIQMGRIDEGLALRATQMDWARRNSTDRDVLVFLCDGGYLLEQAGRSLDAAQAYREATAACEAAGELMSAYFARTNLATNQARLGELDAALEESERAARMRERLALQPSDYAADVIQRASILRDRGAYTQALAAFEDGMRLFGPDSARYWTFLAENQLALCYLALGQPARAQKLLREMPADTPAPAALQRRVARARLARAMGLPGTRNAEPESAAATNNVPLWQSALARIEDARGKPAAEGLEDLGQLIRELRLRQMPGLLLHALACSADGAANAGRQEIALECAREAHGLGAERPPTGMYRPELWWILYRVFDRVGDQAAATTALRTAVDWLRSVALPNVPAEFKDSFLNRNPTNRAVLTTATRRLRDSR